MIADVIHVQLVGMVSIQNRVLVGTCIEAACEVPLV